MQQEAQPVGKGGGALKILEEAGFEAVEDVVQEPGSRGEGFVEGVGGIEFGLGIEVAKEFGENFPDSFTFKAAQPGLDP